jgi:hypothetical protein
MRNTFLFEQSHPDYTRETVPPPEKQTSAEDKNKIPEHRSAVKSIIIVHFVKFDEVL